MKRIFKYAVPLGLIDPTDLGRAVTGPCEIELPAGAQPLSVGVQRTGIVLWASVTPGESVVKRRFFLAGTGLNDLPEHLGRFLGTVQVDWFVGHLFELP